jgi:hypothetical protein
MHNHGGVGNSTHTTFLIDRKGVADARRIRFSSE